MTEPRHLQSAPIVEATIDVRVIFASPPPDAGIDAVAAALGDFEQPTPLLGPSTIFFAVGGAQPVQLPAQNVGVSARSKDGLSVVQIRRDGISLSRARPYLDWEALMAATWPVWLRYRDMLQPQRVKRLSTRFINQIDVPAGRDLDDFFTISPRLPDGSPNYFQTFATSLVIPYLKERVQVVMRTASQFTGNPTKESVILDFDILHDCDLEPQSDGVLRAEISALRPIKNQLFFGSLKEQAMELFK